MGKSVVGTRVQGNKLYLEQGVFMVRLGFGANFIRKIKMQNRAEPKWTENCFEPNCKPTVFVNLVLWFDEHEVHCRLLSTKCKFAL